MNEARTFVPAAGLDFLLPLYDPLLRLMGEERLKRPLLEAADVRPRQRVLDLGCGTGTLAVMLKERCPEADVMGLDPDPKALERARRKAIRAGVEISWHRGFADALPFEDGAFERVVSSFVFHHLPPEIVRATVPELRRVLRPGGSVWILDFGQGGTHGLHGWLARFTSHQHGNEDVAEELPSMMERVGLVAAAAEPVRSTIMGPVILTHAAAPASPVEPRGGEPD